MRPYLSILLLVVCIFSGCQTETRRTVGRQAAPAAGRISQLELRDELGRFEYFFVDLLTQARDSISESTESRRVQRNSLQMRTRIIEALHAMSASDDSVVAFLDTWGLVIRLRNYLEQGAGRQLYGDHQQVAVQVILTAEEEIIRIGQLFLKPEQFEETRAGLESFAGQYPITGTYSNLVVYATQERKREAGALMRTLSIPMAPIRAMEGVDNTANAIHRVRDSVERFTDVAQQMPETARWQMSILMDDFEESEMAQSFLTSLERFSQSSERLVEVLDTMPQEFTTALAESEVSQKQLQETMETAVETVARLEQTLAEAAETAAAVQGASDSVRETVSLFKTKSPRSPDDPPPFTMHDFNNMLTNAGQTADKVTHTVAQLQATMGSGAAGGVQKEMRSLVDHITWRLLQLLLAAFVLTLIVCVVKRKLKSS